MSLPAAQDSRGLCLPDPEGLRDFPVEEELGKIDLPWPGRGGQATQPNSDYRLGRVLAVGRAWGRSFPSG